MTEDGEGAGRARNVSFTTAAERHRRGGLARRIHEVASSDIRRRLLAARDAVARHVLDGDVPLAQARGGGPRYATVGIGADPAECQPAGHYVLRVESNDDDFLKRVYRNVGPAHDGFGVRLVPRSAPLSQNWLTNLWKTRRPPKAGKPIAMGCAIAGETDHHYFGSLGCFVTSKSDDGQCFALTAEHVFHGPAGSGQGHFVVSPARAVCGSGMLAARFGTTVHSHPRDHDSCLISVDQNYHAWAKNTLEYGKRERWLSPTPDLPVLRMKVGKVGAASGYRPGIVQQIGVSMKTVYDDGVEVVMTDLFEVQGLFWRGFSRPGDSGAVVFETSSRRPLGMVVMGSGARTLCVELPRTLDHVGVVIAPGMRRSFAS